MLTRLTIRHFKRFGEEVEIELGNPVVFHRPEQLGQDLRRCRPWRSGISASSAGTRSAREEVRRRSVRVSPSTDGTSSLSRSQVRVSYGMGAIYATYR